MNKLTIDKKMCKACGICIAFCPVNVFEQAVDGTPIPENEEKCIGCNLCVLRCPDFAIKLEVNK